MRHTGLCVAARVAATLILVACVLIVALGSSTPARSAELVPPVRAAAILKARGVMVGYEDGQMRWGNTLTRAEAIKIIVTAIGRADQATAAAGGPGWFSDVDASHWASGYITVGAELGIVRGYPDGSFGPENPVTVAELAVMLSRMYVSLGASPASPPAGVSLEPNWAAIEILPWPGLMSALKLGAAPAGVSPPSGVAGAAVSLDYPASRAETATLVEDTMERAGLAFDVQGILAAHDAAAGKITVTLDQRTGPITLPVVSSTVWLLGNDAVQGSTLVNKTVGVVLARDGKVLLVVSMGV